jgi:hypothetical protein
MLGSTVCVDRDCVDAGYRCGDADRDNASPARRGIGCMGVNVRNRMQLVCRNACPGRKRQDAGISECPRLAPGDGCACCYTRTLNTPSSAFPSGGGAAAGERGRRGFGGSAFVAADVKLPRGRPGASPSRARTAGTSQGDDQGRAQASGARPTAFVARCKSSVFKVPHS